MTVPVAPEFAIRLALRQRLAARCATGAAHLLVRLPPRRLRQALRLISLGSRPASMAGALRARQAAVTVSERCAGLGCLQRSVATALLCRLSGQWPDWCTGFRTQPFRAHAWVEVDGVAVGEAAGTALFHTVLSVRHRDREPG